MIVLPMAGLSARFSRAGYAQPKYMLPIGGRSLFAHAAQSFRSYFEVEPFLFIARGGEDIRAFIDAECLSLGVREWRVELLQSPTAGQAETVALGLGQAGVPGAAALTIFNIDTIRLGFHRPTAPWAARSDGYLEVFQGEGANWSYVEPEAGAEPCVRRTAEKDRISDLCCTGLYHFARAADFLWSLEEERTRPSAAELYVAPLYNHLIARAARIHYDLIAPEAVVFAGVPSEYEAARADSRLSGAPGGAAS